MPPAPAEALWSVGRGGPLAMSLPHRLEPNTNPALSLCALSVALSAQRKSKGRGAAAAEEMASSSSAASDADVEVGGVNGVGGLAAAAAAAGVTTQKKGVHENHPFFSYYGLLIHQQNMLQDAVRTGSYHNAMLSNASDFAGKTVMDVGTGSGILAYFAAQAGARKVYAVEASDVAARAAELMAANGLSDRVIVLKQKVEEVVLPLGEKVDIIVSEPLGFQLIHERMCESFMEARRLFLKPGGRMFPSTGTIFAAPITDPALWAEQQAKAAFWHNTDFYGLDLSSLAAAAARDHFSQAIVGYVDPASLLSPGTASLTIDFEKDEPESLHVLELPFSFPINRTAMCHGLATWFDVAFVGSTAVVTLSTAPGQPGTHWYQCRLLLLEPLAVNCGQRIAGTLHMKANERYSYDLTLSMHIVGSEATTESHAPVSSVVCAHLQDQMYHYLQPQ